jgi:hypothetical protein
MLFKNKILFMQIKMFNLINYNKNISKQRWLSKIKELKKLSLSEITLNQLIKHIWKFISKRMLLRYDDNFQYI